MAFFQRTSATDRPNTFKGYVYYELGWLKSFSTDFGIFQVIYQGSPETSYMDGRLGSERPYGRRTRLTL